MTDNETTQWLLLLGAMLGNKAILGEAVKSLASDDVPEQFKTLWAALKVQNVESIKLALEKYGVEKNGSRATDSLIRALQKRALDSYVKSSVSRATHAGLLGADEAAAFFERMATHIRAKQEAMRESK